MPTLLEAEQIDVEMKRAVHVGNEEHRTRIPPLNNVVVHGLLRHSHLRTRLTSLSFSDGRLHCPCGGCQSSTLLPSGSMTHPNFPYSESSVFSSTLQPSSRSALRSAARSSTR